MAQKDETVTKYLLGDNPQGCHLLSLKTHYQPLLEEMLQELEPYRTPSQT